MPLCTEPLDFVASFNEPSLEVSRILPNASAVNFFTTNVPSTCETVMTSIRRKLKKSVHFRTVTVYYFPRVQGYSSIPSQDGPTLGMSDKHVLVETYDLMDKSEHGIDSLPLHAEHVGQMECPMRRVAFADSVGQNALSTLPEVGLLHDEEPCWAFVPAEQEKRIGSTMQPVTLRQRRKLLREAGVSKIDNVEEAEAREIRISRTFCGCRCKVVCRPNTCLCIRSEIPCQVDNGLFPCACSAFGCGNPAGRLQFDVAQVKKLRVLRLAQLKVESSMDRGVPAIGRVKVELIISPAKRTKFSKTVNMRKPVASKKRTFSEEPGKESSAVVSEKLEVECLPACEEKLKLRRRESEYETVQREDFFNGRDKRDASFKNNVTFKEEKILTKSAVQFREPVEESPDEAGLTLDSVDALDTLQNELNSSNAEETTSCIRACDLDTEDDLDPNCLRVLVIGNEDLEDAASDPLLSVINNFQSRDGVKHVQSNNDFQLQSNLEFESKRRFSRDSKNDLQPAVDIDLDLKCDLVESNKDLQSTDDLDLDLECDVSVNSRSLQPTNDLDTETESDAVKGYDTRNSNVVQTDVTSKPHFSPVNSDLHNAFVIDSSIFCLHKSNKQGVSSGSSISRHSSKPIGKTADADLTSKVAESSKTCIKSQGHIIKCEHHVESEGLHIDSQGHHVKPQGHCVGSEGQPVESEGYWNVLNAAQVAAVDLTHDTAFAPTGEPCDIAAETKVDDFRFCGSRLKAIALREVSSTWSSTLEEVSSTSKEEDLSERQHSENCDGHANLEDNLMDFVCTGSILKEDAVLD